MRDDLFRQLIDVSGAGTSATGQTYHGTQHDDTKAGSEDDDTFNYYQGGNDTLSGNGGNDIFNFRAKLTGTDTIDGGTGDDTVTISGDHLTHPLVLAATTLTSVENLTLGAGSSYSITFDDANIAAGQQLAVRGGNLRADSTFIVDGHDETDGGFVIYGGAGAGAYTLSAQHDAVYGGSGNEQIDPGDGDDLIVGAGGHDFVSFRAGTFNQNDFVNGSAGTDGVGVIIASDVGVGMGEQTIGYVENFMLTAPTDAGTVNALFTMAEGNVSAHKTLNVNVVEGANAKMNLTLDATLETDGHYNVTAGSGDDTITGGAQSDIITTGAGHDHAYGGGGNDVFYVGSDFSVNEAMEGGGGFDTIHLSGGYASLSLYDTMFPEIEKITFDTDADQTMGLTSNAVTDGRHLIVDASAVGSGHTFHFDATLTGNNGTFAVTGGAGNDSVDSAGGGDTLAGGGGNDTLYAYGGDDAVDGGSGDDFIFGGEGQDTLTPGTGHDGIVYGAVNQSTGKDYDDVIGFDARDDIFYFTATTGVDNKIMGGTLSRGSMNADLKTAVDAAHLGANHAVLFAPDAGGLAGKLFLIIDGNGHAGYQANQDVVILLTGALHLNQLDADNFQSS